MIKNLRIEKGWSVRKMLQEFPNKHWRKSGLDRLVRKIDTTGCTDRKIYKKTIWTKALMSGVVVFSASLKKTAGISNSYLKNAVS